MMEVCVLSIAYMHADGLQLGAAWAGNSGLSGEREEIDT